MSYRLKYQWQVANLAGERIGNKCSHLIISNIKDQFSEGSRDTLSLAIQLRAALLNSNPTNSGSNRL